MKIVEATNMYQNLNDQIFMLNKTNETKDYFIFEICERQLISKGLNMLLLLSILVNL